jgi:hypothetical protein
MYKNNLKHIAQYVKEMQTMQMAMVYWMELMIAQKQDLV